MLYVCATPIGNLGDVTQRAVEVLGSVDVLACEDTRHTRRLLDRYGLRPPRLLSFHEHNEESALDAVLELLREGLDVALVTDAGMPGLSDPGFRLVRACAEEGLPLTVLPGPSAVSTALVASGMPTDRFVFVGFLPRGGKHVVGVLEEADQAGGTVVAFESPRRVRASLEAVARRWPERRVALCRELTKVYEEVVRGTAVDVLAHLADTVKGEVVLVLEPVARSGAVGVEAEEVATRLLAEGLGTKAAASIVAMVTGISAKEAYALTLGVKERSAATTR